MRLFTAICFDDEIKDALFSAEKEAEKRFSGSFSLYENLHLTLVFIGETDRLPDIKNAFDETEFSPFDIKIKGAGTFEKGILWAGIEENEKLSSLYKTLFEKLEKLGFDLEERDYVPHITLARKFSSEDPSGADFVAGIIPEKDFSVRKISLMESKRTDGVLRYTEIYSKDFC